MAQLAISLQVFVSSASDVDAERRLANETIEEVARDVGHQRILLVPFFWETDAHPSVGPPQTYLNQYLRESELIVAILGSRLGKGTRSEIELGRKLIDVGTVDNLFLYFKRRSPSDGSPSDREDMLLQLRSRIDREEFALYREYTTAEDLRPLLQQHLRLWLDHWRRIPEICTSALKNSSGVGVPASELSESRLSRIRTWYDPLIRKGKHECEMLGMISVRHYQAHGPAGSAKALDRTELSENDLSQLKSLTGNDDRGSTRLRLLMGLSGLPYIPPYPLQAPSGDEVVFSSPEWYWLFCAIGLLLAVQADDISAVSIKPYVNEVHQFLAGLVTRRDPSSRLEFIQRLIDWLTNRTGTTGGEPIARNFAAYVLGMVGAKEAEDALATAAREDSGAGVRMYSITSLGKIRSRRYLRTLVQFYSDESDPDMRLTIAQAISRVVGIWHFEL